MVGAWDASKVKSIIVYLQDGNDYVSFDSLANGGDQALTKRSPCDQVPEMKRFIWQTATTSHSADLATR